ncbi:TetR/AcrR family transcriptional regulator [Spirilliplanes yamanashiensis]|uniref:Putative transcriptional regulator, TetR n=1 Tax=Spirilliplanes yamanashiensis TaxID=42233 RepID=A0A8J3Y6C6_9ACTN|nr:TetR family transcriptional regulator [Spirilliplanes yamanashiensis]MDP9814562.1 DNA-binding transcriptional regulator YbjK [Spirilliplanes yamanashiensis]GIJ02214.1 putative transcriptional regulator, TetR [Spirilliplanes yamanashiensis]
MSRREESLTAAVEVLGSRGLRHLTHRAVDEQAGMPMGSTSNHFRTREALVAAVIEHLAARERTAWQAVAAAFRPDSPATLAAGLAAYVQHMVGPARALTLARFAVFTEVAVEPAFRPLIAGNEELVRSLLAGWLADVGSADPDVHCRLVIDQLDGLILRELVFAEPDFDPQEALAELLVALAGEHGPIPVGAWT